MLVARQISPRRLGILGVGAAVPVGEGAVFGRDILAVVALRERHSATTRLVGHADGEPLVPRRRDQRRLAEARTAGHHRPLRVQLGNALGKIEPARERPGPRAECSYVVCARRISTSPKLEHARIGERILHEPRLLFGPFGIRRHFAVACAHHSISASKDHADGKHAGRVRVLHDAARLRARCPIRDSELLAVARPSLLHGYVLVWHKLVVAAIIEKRYDRYRLLGKLGYPHYPSNARA